jgi:hypothetical protein
MGIWQIGSLKASFYSVPESKRLFYTRDPMKDDDLPKIKNLEVWIHTNSDGASSSSDVDYNQGCLSDEDEEYERYRWK